MQFSSKTSIRKGKKTDKIIRYKARNNKRYQSSTTTVKCALELFFRETEITFCLYIGLFWLAYQTSLSTVKGRSKKVTHQKFHRILWVHKCQHRISSEKTGLHSLRGKNYMKYSYSSSLFYTLHTDNSTPMYTDQFLYHVT